ncbi:MAG: hypothetical protein C0518_13030 [Opitutus sp.]|nr:hypothetical protein [Opitutus sp.]
MRLLSSRLHGVLDYIVGVLLIVAPRVFGFSDTGAAAQVPVLLGVATIVYSLLTRYPLGLLHVIPFRAHLTLDFISGAFLLGVLEIVAVMTTRRGDEEVPAATRGRSSPAH